MTQPIEESLEKNKQNEFQSQLDAITARQLTADNVDTYADEALEDLIALVQRATETHAIPHEDELTGLEKEREALSQLGIDPFMVEQTLDHIADVAESTKRIDQLVIKKTKLVNTVLVPPDPTKNTGITEGDGSFEMPKGKAPKLKTLLLMLEKGLDVDIESDDEVKITAGAIRPNMMRRASYYMVEIPSLNRVVFVCDEVGNTTYVYNTEACEEYGITPNYLGEQTKTELDELLKEDGMLGRRINHTKSYAENLADALTHRIDSTEMDKPNETLNILKEKAEYAPEGYLSTFGIVKLTDVGYKSVCRAIEELGGKLGTVNRYRFRTMVADGYSPEQIAMVLDRLRLNPKAPEGYLTETGISQAYPGAGPKAVKDAITELGDSLGEVNVYNFGNSITFGYSPAQVNEIIEYLDLAPPAPEGYQSKYRIQKKYNIPRETLEEAIVALADSLGEVKRYQFHTYHTDGFSPMQIDLIVNYTNSLRPPEGYLSIPGMSKLYGISLTSLRRIVNDLGDQLGEVKDYKFRTVVTKGYSADQQRLIIENVRQHSKKIKMGEKALGMIDAD